MGLKVCMIGLGSIGKRHLRNLLLALQKRKIEYQVDALRSQHSEIEDEWSGVIKHQYYDIEQLPNDYDIIFITNPTSLHYKTLKGVIEKTSHLFIEKPVFDSINYCVNEIPMRENSIYYVACPLRHKNIMQYVKQVIINQERVISARIISSSYLPAWRKDVDYRNVYSAQKELGGGVTKDLIHEWDYAVYLFGYPNEVFHMEEHLSDLEIDSDDLSIYIARYPNMFLEMHLDYIGQKTERVLQLFTNDNRIDVDLISNTISKYKDNKLISKLEFPAEDFYMNEMEYFLDCIEKKKDNMNTIESAYDTLKIALSEEK